jgi:hypothetical protein
MALQTINLGTYANDGTGDDLRTAFEKVNSNLTELYSSLYGANVGATPPTTGVDQGELWWSTVDGRLYIRYGTAWVDASPETENPVYELNAATDVSGAKIEFITSNVVTDSVKFASGTNITVTRTDANTITLSSTSYTGNVTGQVSDISNHNLNDLGDVDDVAVPTSGQALVWNGNAWAPGQAIPQFSDFDFQGFAPTFASPLDLILFYSNVDFGTFASATGITIDLGTF